VADGFNKFTRYFLEILPAILVFVGEFLCGDISFLCDFDFYFTYIFLVVSIFGFTILPLVRFLSLNLLLLTYFTLLSRLFETFEIYPLEIFITFEFFFFYLESYFLG